MGKRGSISEDRRRGLALACTAVAVLLVAPLAGSAALESGHFSIKAQDIDEPRFEATRGMKGLPTGGPSNPGGPGTEVPNSFAGTVTCGDESVTVTQAMLDFSDKNREAVAAGGSAETWPGGDWKFVYAGSYYESYAGSTAPMALEFDRSYIFSNSPTVGARDYVVPAVAGSIQFTAGQGGKLFQELDLSFMSESEGETASMIGSLSADLGSQKMELCSYLKFENGKVSSARGPAVGTGQKTIAGSDVSIGEVTGYLRAGMPSFGPEKPSIVATTKGTGFSITDETSFLVSNGEAWNYLGAPASLWHPVKKDYASTIEGKNKHVVTDWTDCFGDSCTVKAANPVVEKKITPADELNPEMITYYTADAIHGANSIRIEKRPNGTISLAEYKNSSLQNAPSENGQPRWEFSRTDGPARFSDDTDGNIYSREYYVDGYAKQNQSQYENAGGSGWLGAYSGGRELEYLGD